MNSSTSRTALITGLRGQDGSYLAEFLLTKKYRVFGTSQVKDCFFRLPDLNQQVEILQLDLGSAADVRDVINKVRPDEVYNLAARSSSSQFFDDPIATADINGLAAVRLLEAILEISPRTRFCQAASSEIFAGVDISPQDENTPFHPLNAYGAAKTYAANIVSAYRARHGLFATTAILFNHESPRRGLDYVTRKITNTVAKIAYGQAKELMLGNLDSSRDWGFAGDYAKAMWLMQQQLDAEDFVIATGLTHTVREFCEIAFSYVGLDYRKFVRIDPQWSRRTDGVLLCGNSSKARQKLNWQPSITFEGLVKMMVDADLIKLKLNASKS